MLSTCKSEQRKEREKEEEEVAQTVDLVLVKELQICGNSTLTASQTLVNKVSQWWCHWWTKKKIMLMDWRRPDRTGLNTCEQQSVQKKKRKHNP
ncbi:hypothetical protein QQF64_025202 [Cirrhinus molitorella]|uniref:Uncharacterized protein n=1 Tax=Cirrhinus molitorella TaxID=172907 RepID=A0ABR3NNN8_9TELE